MVGGLFIWNGKVLGMLATVAAGRDAKEFTKLAAEMLHVVVAAVLGDLADGFCRGDELVLGAF